MKIQMPPRVGEIIHTLEKAGFEGYAVGGCVRDSLLGRKPQDWDITTSATPQQVKKLFRRTVDTGIQHGTVTVLLGDEGFEVTTYRVDGIYEDGRHPKEVTFTPNLEEDLLRRDFTINAMAYNESRGIVDLYGGLEDLERGIIRCVGSPKERFGEDALRMMRAVRFSAQLGYSIEPETFAAIGELAGNLEKISAERIQTELTKLVTSDHPDDLRMAYEAGLTAVFFPEFDVAMKTDQVHKHHCYTVGEHLLHAMLEVPADKVLRLSMLLHDIGKPATMTVDEKGTTHFKGHPAVSAEMAEKFLRRLKYDNQTIREVHLLVRYHDYGMKEDPTPRLARRALRRIGPAYMEQFLQVRRADVLAQSDYLREEKLRNVDLWRKEMEAVLERGECTDLSGLRIGGAELMALGIPKGPRVGEALQYLLDLVLNDPEKNRVEILAEEAKHWLERTEE
ncbi:MAG: HDIG domain-containing protein [Lachnospiraceae bacterium]|nr:HDIG domain-containing protein [Lachnospiraceae bacterium]